MKVKQYSEYSKLYEQRLLECQFLTEQNMTLENIISPLEDLITEEFIKKFLQDKAKGDGFGAKLAKGALAVGKVAKNVASAVINAFGAVFKLFGLDKLTKAIGSIIKNSKLYQSIKNGLKAVADYALKNGFIDENNKPNLSQIWKTITGRCQSLTKDAGIKQEDLDKAGAGVTSMKTESAKYGKLNEDKYDIGDDEVKYYGFFEKVVHALGIKNARFNGVVSQIMKKGAIGLAIMGILKMAGFTLGGLAALTGLGPVAMGVIGGMLLMAGIIILAIWICKPYPTVDDCLKYLHMYFGNHLSGLGLVVIFSQTNYNINIGITGGGEGSKEEGENKEPEKDKETSKEPEKTKEPLPEKSLYPLMIKNLKALQSMLISFDGVKLEADKIETGAGDVNTGADKDSDVEELIEDPSVPDSQTPTKEKKKISSTKLIEKVYKELVDEWKENQRKLGKNEKPGQGTRKKFERQAEQIVAKYRELVDEWKEKQEKLGKNTSPGEGTRERFMRDAKELVIKESFIVRKFAELILEKEFSKQPRNVEITKAEDYLTQAFKNVSKSIENIKNESDSGIAITEKFIGDILSKKMSDEAKTAIKALYNSIYEHLHGKYVATLPNFGALYKESVEVISQADKRKVVAEKIARLAKRTYQFEGEGFYGGMGEFGADMEEFNTTLKQIMDSLKAEKK